MNRAPLDRRNSVPYGVLGVTPTEVGDLIHDGSCVIVDVRTWTQYAEARVRGAVNVCIPSTLLKRSSFDFDKMRSLVPGKAAMGLNNIERRGVLLYDQKTASLEICGPNSLLWTMRKLRQHLDIKNSNAFLGFVVGGIAALPASLIDSTCLPSDTQPVNPLPPVVTNNMIRVPVYNNLRISEKYLAHLNCFPPWIQTIMQDQMAGKNRIAENWSHLQTSETIRINHALEEQKLVSGEFSKNRYSNIAPYSHTRVLLKSSPDYINASYIHAEYSPLHYIATQAPLPSTFNDFWQLVWDEEVPIIMMLTTLLSETGQVKGDNYWNQGQYGSIKLAHIYEEFVSGGTTIVRHITLEKDGVQRIVYQIHYMNWPDVACPNTRQDLLDLLAIKKRLLKIQSQPVVVHCSAGCGRTGTFCTIDTVIAYLEQIPDAKLLDTDIINKTVDEFRRQRLAMVQVARQFLFCYDTVIAWWFDHHQKNET